MFKKHLIVLLGLLVFVCQAIGMNYVRPVVLPLAGLAANLWVDSRLQAEASHNKQAKAPEAPKLGLSRDHDIKGEHAAGVFQRCGFTSAVCND